MASKRELKKLSRADLLELLLEQAKEVDALKIQLEAAGKGEVDVPADSPDGGSSDAVPAEATSGPNAATSDEGLAEHSPTEARVAERTDDLDIQEPGEDKEPQKGSEDARIAGQRVINLPDPRVPYGKDASVVCNKGARPLDSIGFPGSPLATIDELVRSQEIMHAAENEYVLTLARAQDEARRIIDEARSDAALMRLGATREAETMRNNAQSTCDELLATTRKTCANLFAEAEQEIDRLFSEAVEKASASTSDKAKRGGKKRKGGSADGR